MKRLSMLLMCLSAMIAASLSAKAQEVTITLWPGWNWISYPNAESMDVASALGGFVPMEGDMIQSQWTNANYRNGHWRGGVTHFMPGCGYKYYSNRDEMVSFVFNKPPMPTGTLTVTTGELSNITSTTAACSGSAVSNDGTTILMKGVCWATHPLPTTNDSYTEDGNGPGAFTAEMTELVAETEYYVRAYAVSVKGINYGEELSFTTAPQGILNGLFSVSENNQVCFSQGNLQYQASTNTWRFAENQWDFVGNDEVGTVYENGVKSDNTLVSSTYDGWIDLFCWGRGNEPTNVTGREWDVFVDWGINPISNGGNCPNQWWTLSLDELWYLFGSRNTPSGIRFAKAVVNEINGIILLPDDWQESYYRLNNPNVGNSSYASNTISLDDWASLEYYGAVFFPAAGMRYGEIYGSGTGGQYWSCTDMYFDNRGHTMSFSDEDFSIGAGLAFYKDFGQSVRLVRFVQTPSFNINATPNQEEYGSVNGGGVYELGQTCTLSAISNEGYTFKNWEMDGVVVSRENTYSFVVRNDKNYVAIFYENATYPLTYSYNEEDYTATVTGHWDGSNATGDLIIPETVIHNGETYTVTAIDAWAFSECSGLTSVDIPNTVSIIGGGAFYKCSHLSMIAIPSSVTRIENMTFHSSGLVSVSLPENLTEIGQWAFHSCTNLVSVSIPNTVTAIGAQAFIYCYSLVSASLPSGITTIPHGLFQSCGNLTSITIPSGVTNIVSYAFLGCHSLASITILAETPPALDESLGDIFVDVNKSIPVYVPCGSLEAYRNAEGWSGFTNFIEMCPDHAYVDLGLPSGLLWATCNVGADAPEDYGDYFAWGETQPKDFYDWSTYQHCNGSYNMLTKYCNNSDYGYNGFTDNLTILLPEDDAATANWGNDWRMPTKEEWQELYNNTTVTWTQQNGVNGRLFTATNGNSLFLPAAGCRAHRLLNDAGSYGYYWSSSLDTDGPYLAWYFSFYSGNFGMSYFHRYHGESVRAVRVGSQNTAPTGAINGKFTINDNGDQVYFSQGNLQYQASTNIWRFAENQWDYVGTQTPDQWGNVGGTVLGSDNHSISSYYSGWIDLFGWGTSNWNNGNIYYHPWDYESEYYLLGSGYGPTDGTSYSYDLAGSYANADWGVYNPIINGGNMVATWRTLTNGEWDYILNTRNTVSGYRYVRAQVNNINGVILLPDDWITSIYGLNNPNTYNSSFNSNEISASQWTILENAGAIFLPAAGSRDGASVSVNSYGSYWSSSCFDVYASFLVFYDSQFILYPYGIRSMGRSVRLVCNVD